MRPLKSLRTFLRSYVGPRAQVPLAATCQNMKKMARSIDQATALLSQPLHLAIVAPVESNSTACAFIPCFPRNTRATGLSWMSSVRLC